jgi:Tol biopolymer transport system component
MLIHKKIHKVIGLLGLAVLILPWGVGETVLAKETSKISKESGSSSESRHLSNIRQLTSGGRNAEAYFSFDGDQLIFQSTREAGDDERRQCYQIYMMNLDGSGIHRVSTGQGGTTCGYFFPGGRRVLYASTHMSGLACPPAPDRAKRYRWALDNYDIFSVKVDGQGLQRLTNTPGYDAEATISPNGKTIVFTSVRNGDLDLYSMKIDGTGLKRLTHEMGYDGGAFFSPDSQRIVYRASHPQNLQEIDAYRELLTQNLVEPSNLEIYVMNADGTSKIQVTKNGASNFAPFFHQDGRRIIFSSNVHQAVGGEPKGRPIFHLYLVNDDGTGLEQITFDGHFNSFPMFSPDGKKVVWVSDRNAKQPREFNVFLADWVP